MKLYKRYFIKVLLCFSIVAVMGMFPELKLNAQTVGLEKFGIDFTTNDGTYVCTVNWWQQMFPNENEYYITIPSAVQNMRANYVSDSAVYLNGEKLENGAELSELESYSIIECSGERYELHVMYGSAIATMHIKTDSGNIQSVYEDKDYKEPAYAKIIENGNVIYEGALEYIKGRGNSTWDSAKKPFNIKFKEKINLFRMGSAKKWCLLANYKDDTSLKNKLGFDFAEMVGFEFYPESVFVDLYIDNEYIGHYLLSERIEIKKQRINITDLEELNEQANPDVDFETLGLGGIRGEGSVLEQGSSKWVELPENPENITGGYLVEFELPARYDDEKCGFVSNYGQPIIVKSPEYASKEQVEYISNFYQEFEDAVVSGDGYNSKGRYYSEYIDVESVAKMYVFQEFIKNDDGASTSLFFYKNTGGKLVAGPVWDVDLAFGVKKEKNGIDLSEPDGKWMTGSYLQYELAGKYTIFSLLCCHNDFREEAQRQWEECFEPNIQVMLENLDMIYTTNKVSITLDKCKWAMDNRNFGKTLGSVEENVAVLRDFITQRSVFMEELFSDEVCYIEYNSNGGSGSMIDLKNYEKGTVLKLSENTYTNGDKTFVCWNTRASGWGDSYEDGSEITLEEDITLYAQWEKKSFKEEIVCLWQGIMGN